MFFKGSIFSTCSKAVEVSALFRTKLYFEAKGISCFIQRHFVLCKYRFGTNFNRTLVLFFFLHCILSWKEMNSVEYVVCLVNWINIYLTHYVCMCVFSSLQSKLIFGNKYFSFFKNMYLFIPFYRYFAWMFCMCTVCIQCQMSVEEDKRPLGLEL